MGTVPAPYTPTAGDDATQARVLTWADAVNYLLGNATSGGSKRPLCVMRQTVAQSLTSGTFTAITFDVEDVDYDNGHSTVTSTSRYTAATAGWYQVNWGVWFATNATGTRSGELRVNGVAVNASAVEAQTVTLAGDGTGISGSRHVFLNAGDFLELFAVQSSGGALNTLGTASPFTSWLTLEWRSN